ncbi:MAG: hypothetical protein JWL60_1825 [Gemmatimonadetes bacterium]|jgi:hypothetical protein|nr:hypothetical protein [Gemmatimonadota bacterium]
MRDSHAPGTGAPGWLIGRWRLMHAEPALGFQPGTGMEFRADGSLRYSIPLEGAVQHVMLVYRVDGSILRTESPAAPHATATPIRQGPGDTLVIDFVASSAVLVREDAGWPAE